MPVIPNSGPSLDDLEQALRQPPKPRPPAMTPCDYCGTWRSRPCGEGCHWGLVAQWDRR